MNEDLEWLVENVHEWRVIGAMDVYACVYRHHHNSQPKLYWSCSVEDCHKTKQYTRSQWQAARDVLPAQKEWHGPEDGLPPVGVEFEFSKNGRSWEDRVMLFNDGITCLMAHRQYKANRWHYKCDDPDIICRPLRTEEDRAVEEIVEIWKREKPMLGDALYEVYARQIYRAGYRKQDNPK